MSAVVYIENFGLPIIVNDLAISDNKADSPISIPVLNRSYHLNDFKEGIYPVSFKSKSIILKGRLVVTAAGQEYLIIKLFNAIEDFIKYRDITLENLLSFCNNEDYAECLKNPMINWIIIGYDVKHSRQFYLFSKNCKKKENPFVQNVIYAGSGGATWVDKFTEFMRQLTDKTVMVRQLVEKVLLTNAVFVNEERLSPDNLKDGWGGGWEIVYFDDQKKCFLKLDKYCYFFCNLVNEKLDYDLQLQSLFHFSYEDNGFLSIRNFDGNYRNFVVAPINIKNIDYSSSCDSINFSTKTIVFIINTLDKGTNYVVRRPGIDEEYVLDSCTLDGCLAFKIPKNLTMDVIDELKKGAFI